MFYNVNVNKLFHICSSYILHFIVIFVVSCFLPYRLNETFLVAQLPSGSWMLYFID